MKKIITTSKIVISLRITITSFVLILFSMHANAQVFWTENFGTGTCASTQGQFASSYSGANGLWTVSNPSTNSPEANVWYVSASEAGMGIGNCGDGCGNLPLLTNQTLHIASHDNFTDDQGASYNAGGLCGTLFCVTTDIRAESPTINCTGQTGIVLNFNYMMGGDNGMDYGMVEYSDDNGLTWNFLAMPNITLMCGLNGIWAPYSFTLPATCDNNPNVKIGFRWINDDDGNGTNPAFTLDDITLGGPAITYQGISGKVFRDGNSNCALDSAELGVYNVHLMKYDNMGTLVSQLYSSNNGGYYFYTAPGTYRIAVDTAGANFALNCPQGVDTTVVANPFVSDVNFALTCSPNTDLGVHSIINSGWVFPGQPFYIYVNAGESGQWNNINCGAGVSGTVQITINGPVTYLGPLGAALTPTVAGNVFTYTIPDFGAITNSTAFNLIMNTNTNAQLGDTVCVSVVITATSITETNTTNNTMQYCNTVINSYDPNEKDTYPVDVIAPYNDYFTYTVKFQNTGTAPAFNIHVADTLSSLFDLSTFQLINYSHPNTTTLNGNNLLVSFPNIMLADSTSNEPASHGYFQYRIKPIQNLLPGSQIPNTASIYFDYNAPVVTNTTMNHFLLATGIDKSGSTIGVNISPNPFTSQTTLTFSTEQKNTEVRITDVLGKEIRTLHFSGKELVIEKGAMERGIYFVEITDVNKNRVNRKIVVE